MFASEQRQTCCQARGYCVSKYLFEKGFEQAEILERESAGQRGEKAIRVSEFSVTDS
jgi:hypothetical protein